MKQTKVISLSFIALFTAWGCADNDPVAEEVLTPDINVAPYYFSFAAGNAADNLPDVTFFRDGTSYAVALNSAAGVSGIAETNGTFDTGVLDASLAMGYDPADSSSYVVGSNWMDPLTYNQTDNHSISSDGTFYYLRVAGYDVVKFEVIKGSTVEFDIRYAFQANDSTAGSTVVTKTVAYTPEAPALFDFTTGAVMEQVDWNIGLVMEAIYEPHSAQVFPTPSVIVNYTNGSRVKVLTNSTFDDVTEVPTSGSWLEETAGSHPLGYGGTYEILVYHSDVHQVLVENPSYVYIIDDGTGAYYKLRFKEWSAGLILFEYAAL